MRKEIRYYVEKIEWHIDEHGGMHTKKRHRLELIGINKGVFNAIKSLFARW